MNEYDTATFRIEAHATEDEINKALSSLPKNRALTVKNYLLLKHSIESNRLITSSCDARAPIASSDTEEGESMNRRVYGLATEPEDEVVYQYPKDSIPKTCIEF